MSTTPPTPAGTLPAPGPADDDPQPPPVEVRHHGDAQAGDAPQQRARLGADAGIIGAALLGRD